MDEQEEKELLLSAKREYYRRYREKNASKIQAIRERFFFNQMIKEMRSMEMVEDQNSKQEQG